MDFDREYELENAGIDAFDFSLIDDDEKVETLQDAGLDPDDFDGVEFDSSFDAWSNLQDHGLSLSTLDYIIALDCFGFGYERDYCKRKDRRQGYRSSLLVR